MPSFTKIYTGNVQTKIVIYVTILKPHFPYFLNYNIVIYVTFSKNEMHRYTLVIFNITLAFYKRNHVLKTCVGYVVSFFVYEFSRNLANFICNFRHFFVPCFNLIFFPGFSFKTIISQDARPTHPQPPPDAHRLEISVLEIRCPAQTAVAG